MSKPDSQYSLPEDSGSNKNNLSKTQGPSEYGGTKAIISKHKGWMTIDLEQQKKDQMEKIKGRSNNEEKGKSKFAGKEKIEELRPTWMNKRMDYN